MNTINHFIILICLGLLSVSCVKPGTEATEPVEQAAQTETSQKVTAPATSKPAGNKLPKSSASAAKLFRTPSDDISLPTESQIAEGSEPSATQEPAEQNQSGPTISIQPPAQAGSPDNP